MTTALDPHKEREQAEAALSDVRRRIGARDPAVNEKTLDRAESAVRFALARIAAVAEAEAAARDLALQARAADIRAALSDTFNSARLDDALADLKESLSRYCKEAQVTHAAVSELFEELIRLPPCGVPVETSAWTGVTIGGHREPRYYGQVSDAVRAAFSASGLAIDPSSGR
ncbi:MAG: hypothetical protein H0W06_11170 [Chloroflexia bacterium]|nr:hypothetical protein [Chloroflexia bacterium]